VEPRITTRQLLFEKEVVEMSVEQRPVHIEQDVVDLAPIEEGLRAEG
jgi:radical SAM superfamily enzyme